jgi:hypothetical protein
VLHALAAELLEHETLDADDVARIVRSTRSVAAAG